MRKKQIVRLLWLLAVALVAVACATPCNCG